MSTQISSLIHRRSFIGGISALLLSPSLARSEALGTDADSALLRLEFVLDKLRALRKLTKNLLLALLLDAAIEIAEQLYDWWRPGKPTPDPVPPVDAAPKAEEVETRLNQIPDHASEELQKARLLIRELKGVIRELKRQPQPYRTCGPSMSRRPDGTCRDHTRD